MQAPFCTSNELDCVKKISTDIQNCLPPCNGLVLTSFSKSEPNQNLSTRVLQNIDTYFKYMDWFEYPSGLKGNM